MSAQSTSMIVNGKQVTLWNDHLWRQIRERDGVQHDFLADPQYVGGFKSGGGKGGDLMAFTKDSRYIIKEVGKGDHNALLVVTASYIGRIMDGNTLLCTMYLHYTDDEEKSYMVMRNILRHDRPWQGLYDLKGCADDKTLEVNGKKVTAIRKRIWHVHMWCGDCTWSDERVTYYQGKLAARHLKVLLAPAQKARVSQQLRLDIDWLAENNLMDYSLLVGIKRLSWAEFEADETARWAASGSEDELRQPMLQRIAPATPGPDGAGKGDVLLVYLGIIDFLQLWTLGKKVAMALKVLERNKATIPPAAYGERFFRHFNESLQGAATPLEPGDVSPSHAGTKASIDPHLEDAEARDEQMRVYHSCRSSSEAPLNTKGRELQTSPASGASLLNCLSGIFR